MQGGHFSQPGRCQSDLPPELCPRDEPDVFPVTSLLLLAGLPACLSTAPLQLYAAPLLSPLGLTGTCRIVDIGVELDAFTSTSSPPKTCLETVVFVRLSC